MEIERFNGKYGNFNLFDSGLKGDSENVVVFTNGIGRSPDEYELLKSIADRGVRVLGLELAGRKTVDSKSRNREDYVNMFVDYIQNSGIQKDSYFSVGHSAGGLIVSRAAQEDDKGLEKVIAFNPAIPAGGIFSIQRIKNLWRTQIKYPYKAINMLIEEKWPVIKHQFIGQNILDSLRTANSFASNVNVNMYGCHNDEKMNYDIGIFYGELDEIIPLSTKVEKGLLGRGVKLIKLKNQWHNWPMHDPKLATEIITQSFGRKFEEIIV
jgi:pimeloyl-ACP methyl ester carboxylesterase